MIEFGLFRINYKHISTFACTLLLTFTLLNTGQAQSQQLFVSSNTSGAIGSFTIMPDNSITAASFTGVAMDADGIHYDTANDVLYQLNRTDNRIDIYSNGSTNPSLVASSTSDFMNGREIAVTGNKLVVADDVDGANKLYVYNITTNSATLDRVFDLDINLWGIHANSNQLIAIVDNSNGVAVFDNFFNQPAGALMPTSNIAIESLVRTHGITYDVSTDNMYLTDVGEASSSTDGALVRIMNWTAASADGTVSLDEQIRVFGAASMLGNPVDIALDKDNNRIYVAERAVNGGMVLGFKNPVLSGGIAPAYSEMFAGASGLFLSGVETMLNTCDFVTGGTVSLLDGNMQKTIIIDGNADLIDFTSSVDAAANGHSFTYVVTDATGVVLGIPGMGPVDFDPAGLGACNVYGLSYTGNLSLVTGDNLLGGQDLSDACFALSSNNITIDRIEGSNIRAQVFASSNTSGKIGVFELLESGDILDNEFDSAGADADGIFYDEANDVLYQLNRSDNVVNLYTGVNAALQAGMMPTLTATSTSDFTNGREITVANGKLVVADDVTDANKFVVYDVTPTSITFDKVLDANINLWGIQAVGSQLIAIEDNSENVAIYDDFFNQPAGAITPTNIVSVENMVRTHGLFYDVEEDFMILTDVGAASSAGDGALVTISAWSSAISDGMISADEQIRVAGGTSQLGNPVDVAYDKASEIIYVAERARQGGLILGFKNLVASGGIAPTYTHIFPGASAVQLMNTEIILEPCGLVEGGTLTFADGNTETTTISDGNADNLDFISTADPVTNNHSFTYVVTDASGNILGIPASGPVDFDPAGTGACNVYGLSYTGNLLIAVNDNLLGGQDLSDDCFDLSDNNITVNRIAPGVVEAELFVSSNNQPFIGTYDILEDGTVVPGGFGINTGDADGIFYDEDNDVLYQLNRTNNTVDIYNDVSTNPTLVASSTSDFTNGREIAVANNKLVVADDVTGANKFVIYDITTSTITLDKVLDADINLWGIHAYENHLLAISDNTADVAFYFDFFNQPAGAITPTTVVTIENMVRTHGLDYDVADDMLVLTDVGAGSDPNDGALVVVRDFAVAAADGIVTMAEQARAFGAADFLGNPVDVALDKQNGRIYVAERANGGGRILGFETPQLSGGIAPFYNRLFAGASAVFIPEGPCDFLTGGIVVFADGSTTQDVTVNDGMSDVLSFFSDVNASLGGYSQTFVITDASGVILGIPSGNSSDFETAGTGQCAIFNVSYTGTLSLQVGQNIFSSQISSECGVLSENFLTVNRVESLVGNDDAETRSEDALHVASIYPVPAYATLNINIEAADDQNTEVHIYNVAGQLVIRQDMSLVAGNNLITLNVHNLEKGMYFLQVPGTNDFVKFTKMTK